MSPSRTSALFWALVLLSQTLFGCGHFQGKSAFLWPVVEDWMSPAATGSDAAPTPGNGGTVTTSNIQMTSITLNWTTATDDHTPQTSLEYRVYRSNTNNISTVADAMANGTLIQDWTANIQTATDSTLALNTVYFFNVLVRDGASPGNVSAYALLSESTLGDMNALNAWYRFSNNFNDSSGNGLTLSATCPGGTSPTATSNRASSPNTAYTFNGSSSCLTTPASPLLDFTSEGSLSLWVNLTSAASDDKLICKAFTNSTRGYCLGNAFGELKIEFWDATGTVHMLGQAPSPVVPLTLNTWTHIVVTASSGTGGRLRAYINGALAGEIPWGNSNAIGEATGQDLFVGAGWAGDASWTSGAIDDIRIYPRELTANEALYLFSMPPD